MDYIHKIKSVQKKVKELRKKPIHKGFIVALFLCVIVFGFAVKKTTQNGELLQVSAIVGADSSYGDRNLPIYSVETSEPKVALSFDAAWGADDFTKIMDILDQHNVKVTFFMTGGWVETYPECVKTLVEKGHDLGNHSEHHYDMTALSKSEQQQEIMKVHDRVKKLTGYEMFLFRPPYGAYCNSLIQTTYSCNYYPIQWSIDSLDWKNYGVDSVVSTVCNHKNLEPGGIILCHNGAKYTAEALDTMLTNLEEKGYEIVPVSQLIIKENYHMDVTGKQISN